MILQSPGDVLIQIGSFPVYYYGVIMAFACLTGISVSYYTFRYINPKCDYEKIWDFAAFILIFGFLGARLYYCLLNFTYYTLNPLEALNFREGGLSVHGGIIFGIITLILLSKKYKLPVLNLLDAFSCGTILAQSIGRWGNFFNSEAFGTPTDLPWKLYIPLSQRPAEFSDFEYFHPTFLYESLLDVCVFVILLMIIKKFGKKYNGLTMFTYIVLYSIVRIFVEHLRTDSTLNLIGIPIAQIVSFISIIIGVIGIVTIIKLKHENI